MMLRGGLFLELQMGVPRNDHGSDRECREKDGSIVDTDEMPIPISLVDGIAVGIGVAVGPDARLQRVPRVRRDEQPELRVVISRVEIEEPGLRIVAFAGEALGFRCGAGDRHRRGADAIGSVGVGLRRRAGAVGHPAHRRQMVAVEEAFHRRRAGADDRGIGMGVFGPSGRRRPLPVRAGPTRAPLDVGGECQRDVGLGAGTAGAGVGHRSGEPFATRGVGEGERGRSCDDGRRTVLAVPGQGPTEAGRHIAGGVPGVALPADGRRSMGPRRPVGVGTVAGHAGEARAEVVGEGLRPSGGVDVGRETISCSICI